MIINYEENQINSHSQNINTNWSMNVWMKTGKG